MGTITLITGDKVTLRGAEGGRTAATVEPGPGREHLSFSTQEHDGAITVIPHDVLAMVGAGQLDRALFNVTRLLADGFGDEHTRELPLLLTGGSDLSSLRGQVNVAGARVSRVLPKVGVIAVRQDKAGAGALLASLTSVSSGSVAPKIWLDRKLSLSLDRSVPQIGGPAAHARGLTGAGVIVAVLDTGIDAAHPDLAGKVVAAESFVAGDPSVVDIHGHGTHVASIIAGSGAASGGQMRGVATGVSLLNGRVCRTVGCDESAILAGMEWAVDQGAHIVNMSLGGFDSAELDPMEEAVNRLSTQYGTLFVVSSGNFGPGLLSTPSTADEALSVGAVDRLDELAPFSSHGPRAGDKAIKPDLTAPGVEIVAARAAGTRMGAPVNDSYTRSSGTSMATPHVAGAAALLLQQHPEWSGRQLKEALMSAAAPSPTFTVHQQGAGRVDLDRVTRQQLRGEPASLNLGIASYPHDDDPPITRVVRYHNSGDAPVSLTFTTTFAPISGGVTPAGMVTLAPTTLLVPAGGAAEVALTIDTRVAAPDGLYGGALIASGAEARVVTPISLEREHESFTLTVQTLGSAGQPSASEVTIFGAGADGAPDRQVALGSSLPTGTGTVRLPAGTYLVEAVIADELTWLVAPMVVASADTTLTLDGRRARPIEITLPDPAMALRRGSFSLLDRRNGRDSTLLFGTSLRTAEIGASAPPGVFSTLGDLVFAYPDQPAHTTYHVAHNLADHFFTGWRQTYRSRDFARVDASHAAPPGRGLIKATAAVVPDDLIFWPLLLRYDGVFKRVEHYTDIGARWHRDFSEVIPVPGSPGSSVAISFSDTIVEYRAGHRYREPWNRAPFGPSFAHQTSSSFFVDRSGAPRLVEDFLVFQPGLFGDQVTPANHGASRLMQGSMKLFREGQLIASQSSTSSLFLFHSIEAPRATYRLEGEAIRDPALFELSTRVNVAWTFEAEPAGLGEVEPLPLPTMRFFPELDEHNRTGARVMVMPVRIERPRDTAAPAIADATLEASFDDGATWTRVPLLRFRDQALAVMVHPRRATHVSLRSSAIDVDGNALEQTILRAYALRPRSELDRSPCDSGCESKSRADSSLSEVFFLCHGGERGWFPT